MPTWTAKQMSDLDNSMVAAQNVSLGTVLGSMVASTVKSGTLTPTAQSTTIVTGLTTVTAVVASLSGSPTIENSMVSATSGSVAGTIVIKAFKPTSVSNPTPVASSGSFVAVNWVAIGA